MSLARRIMIVEDEPNVRMVFRAALASNDYLLTTATDGESALRWLAEEPADLVLLDLQMPGLGGMETLRRLRDEGIETPVVIVSAFGSLPNVVQAMRLGAVDFLPKPTTPEALRRVVAEVLARHEPVSPATRAADAMDRAKAALNRREFARAEAELLRAVDDDPRCAEGFYLLGVLHELADDIEGARASYRAALKVDSRYRPALDHLRNKFPEERA